nr:MAG TPA: hypothetical protein [Caudoviricetes sp.]
MIDDLRQRASDLRIKCLNGSSFRVLALHEGS